jgi:hypothetical protein
MCPFSLVEVEVEVEILLLVVVHVPVENPPPIIAILESSRPEPEFSGR